jgi:hypothetical protein
VSDDVREGVRDEKVVLPNEDLTTADIARSGQVSPETPALARDDRASGPIALGASGANGGATGAATVTARAMDERNEPLFSAQQSEQLKSTWDKIQVNFVDEPRRSVEEADKLVAETMRKLAEVFSRERDGLEKQWDRGGDGTSTEDLRVAFRRYRSFFRRLLAV